jgi:peptidoglycan/LPS O-acetylase OafA/YrhL
MICCRAALNAPPSRTGRPARSPVRHTSGPRADDRHPRASAAYGRFAVVTFIALSGFSLGLGPARSGWRFKSIATYAHRRAWRILPPCWAALGFSLVMTWYRLAQPGWALPNARSVVPAVVAGRWRALAGR